MEKDVKMFLSKEEMIELTGYKNRPGQIRWLVERGYKFEIARDGRPRVLKAAIIKALGGNEEPEPKKRRVEPNWSQFK